jgi:hypothetical protein
MFKLLAILYIFTYAYDTIVVQKDAPIRNMKEFIENAQYREDQLRYHCNLGNYMIIPNKNLYETIYDDIKKYITTSIEENIYPVLYDKPINCETYNEFIHNSKMKHNINKKLSFNDKLFILKKNNPMRWTLEIDDLIVFIDNIQPSS